MPEPLKFTSRAVAILNASLQRHELEPEQVIRFLIDPKGNVRLAFDMPREDDVRIHHQGVITIIVEPAICVLLSDVIIDSREPTNGLTFTISKRSDSN